MGGEGYSEEVGSTYAPLISEGETIPGQYIVVFKDQVGSAEIDAAMNRVAMKGDVMHSYDVIPGFAAKLGANAVEELRRNPNVAYIEQDTVVSLNTTYGSNGANGIDRTDQRELPLDGVYNDFGRNGSGVHVVVIDTGINTGHNEFSGRMSSIGHTAIGSSFEDCHGHGTHVASSAAGSQYGLAKNATLHASRVLDCNGSGSNSGVIAGVDWTRTTCSGNNWTCVANMSLGGGFSSALNDAVANAVSAGVTFVVAAGNSSANACNYSPASEPSAITVAASDPTNDGFASFSNYGTCVDIIAPGVSIKGAWVGSSSATNTISGTSMASPHVAGAAALYLSSNPGASPTQVQNALSGSASLNCISSVPSGTPNDLLHNDFNAGNYDCGGGGGGNDPNSCEGYCGTQAPGGCWCDSWCSFYGDCCSDKTLVCG